MKFVKMLEAVPAPGHIHLYWLGQAGFLIKNSIGKVMLIDAYLSDYVEKTDGNRRLMMAVAEPEELHPNDPCQSRARRSFRYGQSASPDGRQRTSVLLQGFAPYLYGSGL